MLLIGRADSHQNRQSSILHNIPNVVGMSSGGLLKRTGLSVMQTKRYTATPVGELCGAAVLTEGAFSHYFKRKDELGLPQPIISRR
jgi:hypothetical protein